MASTSSACGSGSRNSAKVNVAIRVRPLIPKEVTKGAKSRWRTDGQSVQQVNPGTKSPTRGTAAYTFDYTFGPETGTQEVYNTVVAPIVQKSFQGFNGTVLCYGQTSSGKTHTLYGSEEDPGIISLMADDLFKRIRDGKRVHYIRIGLLEIYNEKMSDLLNNNFPVEDMEVDGVVVPKNLTEIEVVSPQQILEAAQRVQLERKVGETVMNQQSSRSHTILRIVIESAPSPQPQDQGVNPNPNTDGCDAPAQSSPNIDNKDEQKPNNDLHLTTAVLNFVDLAGSEKASKTKSGPGTNDERFTESNYINKSLTSLSKVVMELSKAQEASSGARNGNGPSTPIQSRRAKASSTLNSGKQRMTQTPSRHQYSSASTSKQPIHINFRDSKLTRILQSSLNGNAFVTMICNLTPGSVPESHSTLRFARTAKEIKIDPTQNKKLLQIDNEYEMKISELEISLREKTADLEKLRSQMFVMQSFQRVCSPVPRTSASSQIPKANLRRSHNCSPGHTDGQGAGPGGFNINFNSVSNNSNNKDRKNQTLDAPFNIPFAEWAKLKKEQKNMIVERNSLKSKLSSAEASEKCLLQEIKELKVEVEKWEQRCSEQEKDQGPVKESENTTIISELNEKLEASVTSAESYKDSLAKSENNLSTLAKELLLAQKLGEKLQFELNEKTKLRDISPGPGKQNNVQYETNNKAVESMSIGIQVSKGPYDIQYINSLRRSQEKLEGENKRLHLQNNELTEENQTLKRKLSVDHNLNIILALKGKPELERTTGSSQPENKSVEIDIETKEDTNKNDIIDQEAMTVDPRDHTVTWKCRFPSFLVPWKPWTKTDKYLQDQSEPNDNDYTNPLLTQV